MKSLLISFFLIVAPVPCHASINDAHNVAYCGRIPMFLLIHVSWLCPRLYETSCWSPEEANLVVHTFLCIAHGVAHWFVTLLSVVCDLCLHRMQAFGQRAKDQDAANKVKRKGKQHC